MKRPRKQPDPPSGQSARTARRLAFAAAFCRVGTAAAALREVNPRAASWKPVSQATEASRYMHDPIVSSEIARIQAEARLDAIAGRQEIARILADIMRGTITETKTVRVRDKDGSQRADTVEAPAPISQRIAAARQLHKMLPEVAPAEKEDEANSPPDEATACLADRLAAIRKKLRTTKAP